MEARFLQLAGHIRLKTARDYRAKTCVWEANTFFEAL
jgi:hypothetical protein